MTAPTTPKTRPWPTWLVCLALTAACFAVYWPILHHGIIYYDDPQYVTDNPHVLTGLKWANVRWAATAVCASNWHPLTMLTHMADAQLFGKDYGKHHLISLLLHCFSAILLVLLLQRLTSTFWRSALVAALFALHPLHVESVAWLAERKDVLSGLFFMLTLLAYAGYAKRVELKRREKREEGRKQSRTSVSAKPSSLSPLPSSGFLLYLLAVVFFALGLMSKPMLVTLPFVLLLLDYWPLERLKLEKGLRLKALVPLLSEKLPFFALTIVSSVVTFYAQRTGGAVNSLESIPLGWRAANAMIAYAIYLGQLFWPTRLAILYPYPLNPSTDAAISVLILVVITLAAIRLVKRTPWFAIGWLWYLGMLVPVIGLVQVGEQAHADRYTYLPAIGVFILVVWSAFDVVARFWNLFYRRFSTIERSKGQPRNSNPSPRTPALSSVPLAARVMLFGIAAFLLALLAYTARAQVRYWQSSYALFQHAADVTQNNYVAYKGLGVAELYQANYPSAMTNLLRALETAGPYGATDSVKYYLGAALQMQGKGLEALKYLEEAKVSPDLEPSRKCRLGVCLTEAGRLDEAEKAIREAMAAQPEKDEFQLAMAGLYQMRNQTADAEKLYRRTVAEHPDSLLAHRTFGDFLVLQNRTAEAEAQYASAITNGTPDVALRHNYATVLSKQGKQTEAIHQLQEGLKQEPANAQLNFELAELLADQGRKPEAIACYTKAIDANPRFVIALNNLAWLLATDPDEQIRDGKRAVELAERACQASNWKYAYLIGTLAAAYAEAGRFPDAMATAEKARDTARANNQEPVAKRNEELLALYRAGKAFHETK
jgi:tetratricopeptide (TPR) repeat protein